MTRLILVALLLCGSARAEEPLTIKNGIGGILWAPAWSGAVVSGTSTPNVTSMQALEPPRKWRVVTPGTIQFGTSGFTIHQASNVVYPADRATHYTGYDLFWEPRVGLAILLVRFQTLAAAKAEAERRLSERLEMGLGER